jgi:hypothetical protein
MLEHTKVLHILLSKQLAMLGACFGNDQEWYNAFDEAAAWATSAQLRQLFVTMLLFCEVVDEYGFFERVWRLMADDIQYQFKENTGNTSYIIPDPTLKDFLLDDLTSLFARNGGNIREHSIPSRNNLPVFPSGNRLIEEELNYDAADLLIKSEDMTRTLNNEQLHAFYSITAAVNEGKPVFFFVSGYMVGLAKHTYGTLLLHIYGVIKK